MSEGRPKLTMVLRELVARRATGVLTVRAESATGEIRIGQGAIEDVVFGRAEGKKALSRILANDDPVFAFNESSGDWIPRIETPMDELFSEATKTRDALRVALEPFADRLQASVVAVELTDGSRNTLSSGARVLWSRLRAPLVLQDVLDLSPADDAEVLSALIELDSAGALRWLWPQSERQPLVTALWDRDTVAQRLAPKARIVFAGTPDRLAVFGHSLSFVDDVTRSASPLPLVPMPYVMVTTTLERTQVEVVACPLVPVYSPLWPLSLAGAALVVRLDEAAPELLETVAELVGVRVVQAEALVGPLDEARVGPVVALVRAALSDAAV